MDSSFSIRVKQRLMIMNYCGRYGCYCLLGFNNSRRRVWQILWYWKG